MYFLKSQTRLSDWSDLMWCDFLKTTISLFIFRVGKGIFGGKCASKYQAPELGRLTTLIVLPRWLSGKEYICLPVRETRVQSQAREDPTGEGNGNPSSILAWRIPWTEGPGGLQSMGCQRVGQGWMTECMHMCARVHTHTSQEALHMSALFLILFPYRPLQSIE